MHSNKLSSSFDGPFLPVLLAAHRLCEAFPPWHTVASQAQDILLDQMRFLPLTNLAAVRLWLGIVFLPGFP